MFLYMVITGPNSPGWNLDVCLQPLIDELKQLWSSRTLTYNVSRKPNSHMNATLMWTINDFPSYKMVSDWTMYGKLTCPYCIENNKAFILTYDGKTFFFFLSSLMVFANWSQVQKEQKKMLHRHYHRVKNYMTWCYYTMTLCLILNLISKSFLVLVWPIIR